MTSKALPAGRGVSLPSRKDAVFTLLDEAIQHKRRARAFAKCSVALQVLGLDNREVIEVLHHLELCSPEGEKW